MSIFSHTLLWTGITWRTWSWETWIFWTMETNWANITLCKFKRVWIFEIRSILTIVTFTAKCWDICHCGLSTIITSLTNKTRMHTRKWLEVTKLTGNTKLFSSAFWTIMSCSTSNSWCSSFYTVFTLGTCQAKALCNVWLISTCFANCLFNWSLWAIVTGNTIFTNWSWLFFSCFTIETFITKSSWCSQSLCFTIVSWCA